MPTDARGNRRSHSQPLPTPAIRLWARWNSGAELSTADSSRTVGVELALLTFYLGTSPVLYFSLSSCKLFLLPRHCSICLRSRSQIVFLSHACSSHPIRSTSPRSRCASSLLFLARVSTLSPQLAIRTSTPPSKSNLLLMNENIYSLYYNTTIR